MEQPIEDTRTDKQVAQQYFDAKIAPILFVNYKYTDAELVLSKHEFVKRILKNMPL